MPYNLSIVRSENGVESHIPLSELHDLSESRDDVDAPEQGEHDIWLVRCHIDDEVWFALFWQEDYVFAQYSEPDAIELLVDIANDLGGRLRGEEGESYRSADDAYYHPDDEHLKPPPIKKKFFLFRRTWVDDLPLWYRFVGGLVFAAVVILVKEFL